MSLFILVLLVHGFSRVSQSTDSMWSVHLGLSIMREGDTDLDEYRDAVLNGPRYVYEIINGHIYSSYPIGTPLLVAPIVYLIDLGIRWLPQHSPGPESSLTVPRSEQGGRVGALAFPWAVERLIASLLVALTAVVMYFVGRQFLNRWLSLLLACVFAFCTPAWSTASRALWQHGPSMLMLAAALLILLKAHKRPFLAQFASLPLAYSFVIRPTNALSIIALTIYVAIRYRRYLLRYLAWSLVVVVPFVWYDLWLYHSILPTYFAPSKVGAVAHLFEGLAGTLVSPSRGLFVYSPVFLFSICGVVLNLKKGKDRLFDLLLVAVATAHWLVISSFPDWYGGHSFGPRYFADMVPYLVYFLVPVLTWFAEARGVLRGCVMAVFLLLVLASFLINLNGAVNRATQLWNVNPVNVDEARGRLWDWADPQFLRGITRE
ncbi:MAG: hypothetical protein NTX53_08330 [candidate division WOR-3 bacterium]|nr:hypothetical protein [candidate division WOR-3 bacterium]